MNKNLNRQKWVFARLNNRRSAAQNLRMTILPTRPHSSSAHSQPLHHSTGRAQQSSRISGESMCLHRLLHNPQMLLHTTNHLREMNAEPATTSTTPNSSFCYRCAEAFPPHEGNRICFDITLFWDYIGGHTKAEKIK